MDEVKTQESEFKTADLPGNGAPKPSDGPVLVKSQKPETLNRADPVSAPVPLFSESEMG